MNEREMLDRLQGVPAGTKVFVSYLAGRRPTARAIREAERARREGISLHHYTGVLTDVRRNRNGEAYMTVLTDVRDNEETGACENHRSFNPSLGNLVSLELLELPEAPLWQTAATGRSSSGTGAARPWRSPG